MPNLTIRNLPADVHERLKLLASSHRRSVNQEIVALLTSEMRRRPLDVEAFLADLDRLHARLNLPPLTDEMIADARRKRRP